MEPVVQQALVSFSTGIPGQYSKQPFFTHILYNLSIREMTEKEQETYFFAGAMCDGETLAYNPQSVKGYSVGETASMLAHEALHVVFKHLSRGQAAPIRSNIAGDLVINSTIKSIGMPVHEGWLMPSNLKKLGLSWKKGLSLDDDEAAKHSMEEVLARIDWPEAWGQDCNHDCANCKQGKECPGMDRGGACRFHEHDSNNPDGGNEPWERVLARAAEAQKQQDKTAGRGMGTLGREIDKVLNPRKAWWKILAPFVSWVPAGRSWALPNRKYIMGGLYMPSEGTEPRIAKIILAFDTSGSMGQDEYDRITGEARGILSLATDVTVLFCDDGIQATYQFKEAPKEFPQGKGYGGTSFHPVFEWVKENILDQGQEVRVLIYFTDGYPSGWPDPIKEYPVLWGMTTDVVAPWGQTILLN